MTPSPVLKKLRLQAGQKALILNAPPGYLDLFGELPAGAMLALHSGASVADYDFVQLFARNQAELEQSVATALQAVRHDGLLWISYPKLTSSLKGDLSRDTIWKFMIPTGLRPVTQIAIDETWSALRFRPVEKVG